MNYWLFKTGPNTYSLDDLKNEPNQTTYWEGIRNGFDILNVKY